MLALDDGVFFLVNASHNQEPLEQYFDAVDELLIGFIEEHTRYLLILDDCLPKDILAKLDSKITVYQVDTKTLCKIDTYSLLPVETKSKSFKPAHFAYTSIALIAIMLAWVLYDEPETVLVDSQLDLTIPDTSDIPIINPYDHMSLDFQRGSAKGIYIQLHQTLMQLQRFPSWRLTKITGNKESISVELKALYNTESVHKLIQLMNAANRRFVIKGNELIINISLYPSPTLQEPILASLSSLQSYLSKSFKDWVPNSALSFEKNQSEIRVRHHPNRNHFKNAFSDDLDVITTILNGFPVVYQNFELEVSPDSELSGNIKLDLYSCGNQC